jgi:hypothetical protein
MPSIQKLQVFLVLLAVCGFSPHTRAGSNDVATAIPPVANATRLVEAYPDTLEKIDGNELIWRDGTRMALDDGRGVKSFADWIENPDIQDMLRVPYPAGTSAVAPQPESDPGRARNATFFEKMYGDCRKGAVKPQLKTVVWLPKKANQRLQITAVNGVADRLEAVSQLLDALPAEFDKYLRPAAGTYNCRTIAGTNRVSGHGYGIAIDIAVGQSDYWRWAPGAATGQITYRNRIPVEIVHIFEQHGFIWGGHWYHYDTMHFEYRPELLPRLSPLRSR